MDNTTIQNYINNGYVNLPLGEFAHQLDSLLPSNTLKAIESIISEKSRCAILWRDLSNKLLDELNGRLLFTTFENGNAYKFDNFLDKFSIIGGNSVTIDKFIGINFVAMANESPIIKHKLPSTFNEVVVHMLAAFPSNIENNFYITIGNIEKISFRFSNSEISLVENSTPFQHDNTKPALYSFVVGEEWASVYINGVLQLKKKIRHDCNNNMFSVEIIGHESADLSASIMGVEVWDLDVKFKGFEVVDDEVISYRLDKLLENKSLTEMYRLITRFDDLDISNFEDRIFKILDDSISNSNGISEWIFNDILLRVSKETSIEWKRRWINRIPEPTLEVSNLNVIFYEKPNERLQLSRIIKRKKAETFNVLSEINFKAYPGDVLGIIGANGAGKSTLLRAVSGLLPVDSGSITIKGQHLLLSPGMGIRNELSGKDNIYLACCFMGLTLKETSALYEEIVQFSELEEYIDRPFKFYSDGMKSRLIFSIATSVAPDILMLDELLNAGDIKFQKKAALRMDELIDNSKVVIVVTHSIPFVIEKCNKALLISKGRQIAYGDTDLVVNKFFNEIHMKNPMDNLDEPYSDNIAAMQQIQQQSFLPGA
jgi:ABC-type polysaccharide/polyol phosphate transport system ATPase subunit